MRRRRARTFVRTRSGEKLTSGSCEVTRPPPVIVHKEYTGKQPSLPVT